MTHTLAANWPINNTAWFSWSGTRSHLRNLLSGSTFCCMISTLLCDRRRRCHTCSPGSLLMAYQYTPDFCTVLVLLVHQAARIPHMQSTRCKSKTRCVCWFYHNTHVKLKFNLYAIVCTCKFSMLGYWTGLIIFDQSVNYFYGSLKNFLKPFSTSAMKKFSVQCVQIFPVLCSIFLPFSIRPICRNVNKYTSQSDLVVSWSRPSR